MTRLKGLVKGLVGEGRRRLTFFSLKMCRLPLPFVDTFFSDAGALYLVLLKRADLRWISCFDWKQIETALIRL